MRNRTILIIAAVTIITFSFAGARTYGEKSAAVQDNIIRGTSGDDTITPDSGGNDLILAGAGDDKIKDGPGDDYIIGGEGNDTVVLGAGNDFVNLGPGDDTLVINMNEDIGNLNYADGGEGNDTVIFVTDDADKIINNEILQYYEKEKVYGKKIVDMGQFNVAAGLSGFEQVGFAASYTF